MSIINQFLEKNRIFYSTDSFQMKAPTKRVVCADGFSMSVQGSSFAYCTPRTDEGPYIECEIGFPSAYEPLINEYAEEPIAPCDTVYPYVPVEIIDSVIESHGGLKKYFRVEKKKKPRTKPLVSMVFPRALVGYWVTLITNGSIEVKESEE